MSRRQRAKSAFSRDVTPSLDGTPLPLENPRYQFASFITAIFIICVPSSTFEPVTTILAIAGLGFSLFKYKWFWPTVFVFALLRFSFSAIYTYDNHEWLFLYWLLTLSLYSMAKNSERQLQVTARLLIGLTFVFATIWKSLSPEFRSGSFFEFAGATEPRFTDPFTSLGLINSADVTANLQSIGAWKSLNGPHTFALTEVVGLDGFWTFLTFATLLVEGAIAIAFLAPLPKTKTWIRDVALSAFAVGTYVLMPVLGFGHLLCILGYTASDLDERKRKYLYVGLLVFIQATPLRDTVLSWVP